MPSVMFNGVLYDKQWRTARPVVLIGDVTAVDQPPTQPPQEPGTPTFPISWPDFPWVGNPIWLPGYPGGSPGPGWGGGNKPPTEPPVDVPPDAPPESIVKPPPPDGGWGWSPAYGWGYFPGSGSAGPKK